MPRAPRRPASAGKQRSGLDVMDLPEAPPGRGSPVHQAGVREGDRLLRIDDRPVNQDVEFYFHLLEKDAGDPVYMKVNRNGLERAFTWRLEEIPIPDGSRLARELFG